MSEEPETDAHIRALLAELGSGADGESMPPEVAARLDATVARLVAERGVTDPEDAVEEERLGSVVPLRRRWLPRATAAAAAVIVLGAGGLAAADLGVFGNDALISSDQGGATSGGSESKAEEPAPEATSATPGPDVGGDSGARAGLESDVPDLTADSFVAQVTDLVRDERRSFNAPAAPACPGPAITDGSIANQVRYDGKPAVLVVHPGQGGRRLVEAWDCTGVSRLDATTVTR